MDRPIKVLIWIYAALLIFEGALRKWVLPSLSDPLLIIRDPVVILIYLLALGSGRFPRNGWVIATGFMAVAAMVGSLFAGQNNFLVTLYGLRTNFLHLPLIWVMAGVLTRREAENLGKGLLLLVIPMTVLMVFQYLAPPDSYINRGVGLDDGVGQIYGAMGHIRPPGFFSFITGPNLYYPFVAALLFHQFRARRRLWWPLLLACTLAIGFAVPVSISRTLAVSVLFIAAAYAFSMLFTGVANVATVRLAFAGAVAFAILSYLPLFDDARNAFLSRWDTAAGSTDASGVSIVSDRVFSGGDFLWASLEKASLFGEGIGMGSNVAARLTTGRMGFTLAENEWAKCLLEMGLPLGLAFVGLRFLFAFALLRRTWERLRHHRDALPWMLFCGSVIPLVSGQWAQPTSLGFAALGTGLCLATCQDDDDPATEEAPAEDPESDDTEVPLTAEDNTPT